MLLKRHAMQTSDTKALTPCPELESIVGVLDAEALSRVTGGDLVFKSAGPLDNGNFVKCRAVAGGTLECGEFRPGQPQQPVKKFNLYPWVE